MCKGLVDKRAYLNTIGCLLQDPTLIDDIDRPLDRTDFNTETFYELLYIAIYNLHMQGCTTTDEFSVDSYLSNYKDQYTIFQENNGLEYLANAKELATLENYDYFYHRVRKYSLLRYYEKQGLSTRFIYDGSVDTAKLEMEQKKFDEYTEQDIVSMVESTFVLNPNMKYCSNTLSTDAQAGDGINELIEDLCETPDVGVPFTSLGLNTVARGFRLGKFYLRSGTTGSSKSRQSIMDCCNIAIPHRWNLETKSWEYTGNAFPTLFISTEMSVDECQTIILATVSGVNEEHILYGNYKNGEKERVLLAAKYLKESPLYINVINDFSISDIENIIKRYHNSRGVNYIFFDYIFVAPRLIAEMSKTSSMRMQEYQLLTMFATRLKALAESLWVFIMSSTQLNGEAADMKYKDARCLQGSKAIANKIDFGCISMRPTAAELKKIEAITKNIVGCPEINMMQWVYKVRRGKLTRIIIFSNLNLGCMREKTVFVTDYDFNLINVDFTKIECMDKVVEENSHIMRPEDFEPEKEDIEEESAKKSFDW